MRKIFMGMMVAGLLSTSLLSVDALEGQELVPLYRYDKIKEGHYDYNPDKPLYYYEGSDEQIMIPKEYHQEKRQFKSAWVATIFNINIPTPKSEAEFKELYMERLNDFVDWNMNAMIFQVRPLLDAYYPSKYNPTSQYLSGKQGVDVDYDPLEWMIEVTHAAGLEYHAWLNPYRVTNSKPEYIVPQEIAKNHNFDAMTTEEYIEFLVENGVLSQDNFAVKHPEYVIVHDQKLILNPGEPEVRKHVMDTVEELITNYDLDAIHFDDYFYPYGTESNEHFNEEDRATFEKYGLASGLYEDNQEGLEAWRRDNVTNLIRDLKKLLNDHNKKNNRAVQLGISPFGIWEHKANHPEGSNTPSDSSQTYSESIFADTKGWVEEEIIDYIIPQIYWSFDTKAAPYAELARWWANTVDGKNVHLYVGHPNYKYVEGWKPTLAFLNPEEIDNQLKFNQLYPNIKGSALFSYSNMNPKDFVKEASKEEVEAMNASIDVLKGNSFSKPSLVPSYPWLTDRPLNEIKSASIEDGKIKVEDSQSDFERYYLIYRGKKNQDTQEIIDNIDNLEKKVLTDELEKIHFDVDLNEEVLIVTSLDRANRESLPFRIELKEDHFVSDWDKLKEDLNNPQLSTQDKKHLLNQFKEQYHLHPKWNEIEEEYLSFSLQLQEIEEDEEIPEEKDKSDIKEKQDQKDQKQKDSEENRPTKEKSSALPSTGVSNGGLILGVGLLSIGYLLERKKR